MSPGVLIDVDVLGWLASLRTPGEKIRAALERCRGQGVRILHGDYGVQVVGDSGWIVDPRRRPAGVNVLGAVCVAFQPLVSTLDPLLAAAATLEVTTVFAEGVQDGFDNVLPERPPSRAARRLYLDGTDLGHEIRHELTQRCEACGSRHFRADACPLCEERCR